MLHDDALLLASCLEEEDFLLLLFVDERSNNQILTAVSSHPTATLHPSITLMSHSPAATSTMESDINDNDSHCCGQSGRVTVSLCLRLRQLNNIGSGTTPNITPVRAVDGGGRR